MTATVISKSWMHFFIQICLCQKGAIVLGGNCPDRQLPPRKTATQLGLAFELVLELVLGLGGQFSSGKTVLELSKELRFVFIKIWWKYEIDHFPIRIFRRCHNYHKIST